MSSTESKIGAYVVITPARNEAAFIELTLKSMVAQTVRPIRWMIVSDGSTDGTDELVRKYSVAHDWIELVRTPERKERHFAGKVHAFNLGYERVKGLAYEFIASLDGDISFDEDYFEYLLGKFAQLPNLGVGGTPFREGSTQYDYRFTSVEHVSGACQLFRRECFEAIGGYVPIRGGGIDLIAVISARMKGWQTRSFMDKVCFHHRTLGTAQQSRLMVSFKGGRGDYALGCHPVWECVRSVYQMSRRPFVLAGGLRLTGFLWAMLTRVPKAVPAEVVHFRRREQMRKLGRFVRNPLTWQTRGRQESNQPC